MSNLINLQLDGVPSQDGHVLLADFLERASSLLAALNEIDRLESNGFETTLNYRIVDAKHTSPLTLTIEPVLKPNATRIEPEHIARRHHLFFETIRSVRNGTRIPEGITDSVLEPIRRVATGAGTAYLTGKIFNGDASVALDSSFESNINRLVFSEEFLVQAAPTNAKYIGEIQGIVHSFFKESKKPYLVIRELSTRALVRCYFSPAIYEKAVETLTEREGVVFVEGNITEDLSSGVAQSVDVVDFRPAPNFDLEFFTSFLGSRPTLTGGLSSEDWLEKTNE